MGEVYRARDTKLNRQVALKVLPATFAADAERLARFRREAQVLAALNHPNIATIYGFDDAGATHALVMEFVEGQALDEILSPRKAHSSSAKGQAEGTGPKKLSSSGGVKSAVPVPKQEGVPLGEALTVARQIADALEFAHERGIIHRDLKPANIKIREDGTVKVLDFGLAKALSSEATTGSADALSSPTLTGHATQIGVILGTAAYMAPEQAKGKNVDRRADIWSFGCVLFEMLARKMAFSGETVTDTLAAVLKEEPDWSILPPETPLCIRELLRRCMKKDPKQRLQSIGDARITIEEALSGAPQDALPIAVELVRPPLWRRVLPWVVAAACLVAASIATVAYLDRREEMLPSLRLTIDPPHDAQFGTGFALSPDGTRLVFAATSNGKQQMLWMRPLASLQAQPIPGTEQGDFPFWSPDGKSIGFFASGKLKRLDLGTGSVQNLCPIGDPRGGAWSFDGTIVFSSEVNTPLMKIPATGGMPVPATAFDPSRQERSDRWPFFLPDGRHFVFLEEGNSQSPDAVAIGSLGSYKTQVLLTLPTGSAAIYANNHLVYSRSGSLVAQPFDNEHLKLLGDPVLLAENVSAVGVLGPTGYLSASASATGLLIYRNNVAAVSLFALLDRRGKTLGTIGPPAAYGEPALSPDEKKIAVTMPDPEQAGSFTPLWLMDVATGASSRFTFDNFDDGSPIWSPDGRWIYFSSNRGGAYNIYRKLADGSADAELVLKSINIEMPSDISKDNRFLLLDEFSPLTNRDLLFLPLQPVGEPKPFRATAAEEADGRFSPDGRWVAYCSDENRPGDFEIFVSSFPPSSSKWQVSSGGGYWPMWSHDGRELYFTSGTTLMAADVIPGSTFQFRSPHPLFPARLAQSVFTQAHSGYFVFTGGQKFLLNQLVSTGESPPLIVVASWTSELKKK
jgi:serine/threonine protein kinase